MPTYSTVVVSTGAEVLTNQLQNTAVYTAGGNGKVFCAFTSNDAQATCSLKGATTGKIIVPTGSHAQSFSTTAEQNGHRTGDFIYNGTVTPGEALDLEITQAAACTTRVTVITQ